MYEIYQLSVDVVSINSRLENRRDASDKIRSTFSYISWTLAMVEYQRVVNMLRRQERPLKINPKDMFFFVKAASITVFNCHHHIFWGCLVVRDVKLHWELSFAERYSFLQLTAAKVFDRQMRPRRIIGECCKIGSPQKTGISRITL